MRWRQVARVVFGVEQDDAVEEGECEEAEAHEDGHGRGLVVLSCEFECLREEVEERNSEDCARTETEDDMQLVLPGEGEYAAEGGCEDCCDAEREGHGCDNAQTGCVTQVICVFVYIGSMRKTRVTQLVAEIFRADSTPLSLSDLHARVAERLPATAYSTIYRLVQRLERDGKINRVDWRERGSRFEWAELPHHHHIVCGDCGRSVDLDDADLGFSERRIERRTGFVVKHHSIELEGTCFDCQPSESTA